MAEASLPSCEGKILPPQNKFGSTPLPKFSLARKMHKCTLWCAHIGTDEVTYTRWIDSERLRRRWPLWCSNRGAVACTCAQSQYVCYLLIGQSSLSFLRRLRMSSSLTGSYVRSVSLLLSLLKFYYLCHEVLWSDMFVCLFVCLFVRSFVVISLKKYISPIFIKFGTDVQHLRQMSPITRKIDVNVQYSILV